MDKFKELYNRLTNLSDTYKSDKKLTSAINSVQAYVTTQEKYYNLIPVNIRTTNTMQKIITNLSYKIDQITYVPKQNYVNLNPNYEEDTVSDANCDTITLAYLTQQDAYNTLQQDSQKQLEDFKSVTLTNTIISSANIILQQQLDEQKQQSDTSQANAQQQLDEQKQQNDILQQQLTEQKQQSDTSQANAQQQLDEQKQQLTEQKQQNDTSQANAQQQLTEQKQQSDTSQANAQQQLTEQKQQNDILQQQLTEQKQQNDTSQANAQQQLTEQKQQNDTLQQQLTEQKQQSDIQQQKLEQQLVDQKLQDTIDCDTKLQQQLTEQKSQNIIKIEQLPLQKSSVAQAEIKLEKFKNLKKNKSHENFTQIITDDDKKNLIELIKIFDLLNINEVNEVAAKQQLDTLRKLRSELQSTHAYYQRKFSSNPEKKNMSDLEKNINIKIEDIKDKFLIFGSGPDVQTEESYCSIM